MVRCVVNNVKLAFCHYKTVHDHAPFDFINVPLSVFFLINCNCGLSAEHSVHLQWLGHHSENFKLVSISIERAIASLL